MIEDEIMHKTEFAVKAMKEVESNLEKKPSL